MRKVILLAAILALGGCVSSGTEVKSDQLATLEKGKTTYAEAVARLGTPNSVTTMAGGKKMVMYMFTKATPNAATFIPVVGLFAGGAHGQSSTVIMTFGANDVLEEYTASTGQSDAHVGL
ncbi:hypothetical protein [Nitrospirillum amazonense]|uniref:hypothetical protein n=1 Tax=Nitrospirillum amazonense TaxID=28077 RepID=UPI00241234AF|nr:hypothetical protein [Nitrospirillum amazonense]MDG3442426.1 hypothetical protein [Nitrospirillum amazonense]